MYIGNKYCKCHQLQDRSFFYHGMQFPVCARCTGIYLGFLLLGPIITVFTYGNMYLNILLILLLVIDGTLQLYNICKSNNIRRLISGLGFGYASFSILVHIIIKIISLFI